MGFWIAVLAILTVAVKYGRKTTQGMGRGVITPEEKFRNANRGACPADTFPQGAVPKKGATQRQAIVKPPPLRTPLAQAKLQAVSTRERVGGGAATGIPVIMTHTITVPEGQKYIGRGFLPIPIQKCPPPTLRTRPPLSATPAKPMPATKWSVAPKPVAFRSQPQPAPTAAPAKPVATKPPVTTVPAESLQGLIVKFLKWIGLAAVVVLFAAAPTFAQNFNEVQLTAGQQRYFVMQSAPWSQFQTNTMTVWRFRPSSPRISKISVLISNEAGTLQTLGVSFFTSASTTRAFLLNPTTIANGWTQPFGYCGVGTTTGGLNRGQGVTVTAPAGEGLICYTAVPSAGQIAVGIQLGAAAISGNVSIIISQEEAASDFSIMNESGYASTFAEPFPINFAIDGAPISGKPFALLGGSDGTNGEAMRTASASVLGNPTSQAGVQVREKSGRWQATSNPAAGSQATASRAAGAAGVRHVADCISFSAASTTAPVATALTVNLRDGASGAGTVIWTYQVVALASTGQNVAPHSVCGLNLIGTAATAMTLEFSAGLANLIEAVSLSGYSVN